MLVAFTDCIGFWFITISDFLMSEPIIYIIVLLALTAITKFVVTLRDL